MQLSDYLTVFNNILINFSHLRSDFIGFGINTVGAMHFFLNVFFTAFLILIYYLTGQKIRLLLFKGSYCKKFVFLVDVALGYIFVNLGLAILGIFSLLYTATLWIYIIAITFISIYPFHTLRNRIKSLSNVFDEIKGIARKNNWVFLGVFLFVFIAFLRLIPSETGEDAIGYHTGDPHLFLINKTTVLSDPYVAMPAPHLGEMSYLLSEFVGLKDSTRYIHFSFYALVVFLLLCINPYAALFFVTAPVVIQISSKANVDFQWILCWILAILLISQNRLKGIRSVALIGILFGGVIASKLWTIAFFPIFILYLLIKYRKLNLTGTLNGIFIFSLAVFSIDFVWLWRSYVISGNPLYPMFSELSVGSVIGFNKLMFHIKNIIVFSPLFFLAIAVFLLHWRHTLKILHKFNLSLFFAFLVTEYIFVKYHFGRYLLGLYSLGVIVISQSVKNTISKYKIYQIALITIFGIMFTYYFLNTLMQLPYGFGWADNNKYLTRILFRDNASYYDFDHLFDKWISENDKVATYGILGYYYANFDYVDVNYILDNKNRSFDLLRQNNVTKLLVKGGDILWFCKTLDLSGCNHDKVKLLATYPKGINKYNLYAIVGDR